MFYFYLDDSATMNGAVINLAGYAAHESVWHQFCVDWLAVIDKHRLTDRYLHTADFLAKEGPYKALNINWEEKVSIIREFISVINKHLQLGVVVSVDTRALRELVGAAGNRLRNADWTLERAYRHLLEWWLQLQQKSWVHVICDDGPSSSHMLAAHRRVRSHPGYHFLGGIAFLDDRRLQPLQAADLLACLHTREYAANSLGRSTGLPPVSELFGESILVVPAGASLRYSKELFDRPTIELFAHEIRAATGSFSEEPLAKAASALKRASTEFGR